ncbi:MAG: hypothetical protein SFX73_19510 [Kofleriaceae bacterium]|nr:hypothetical protein [Kofleriaceae bacterium]
MRAKQVRHAIVLLGLLAACGSKKANDRSLPPEVTGLAAVPSTAQVVIAADVGKLASSPIVTRAVEQLLLREPGLAERWAHITQSCKLDLTRNVKHVILALGPPAQGAGSGPVMMVATGSMNEADLQACMRTMVGKGGGSMTTKSVGGRSLYQVKDGNRVMHFAFGRPDTVVLGTDETWVNEGLGTGQKAMDNPDLKGWLAKVDQRAPLWAVGRVDERVRAGLVGASGGKLKAGPTAIFATVDPSAGAKLELGTIMASPEDAKSLESFANNELKLATWAAQLKSLGPIVAKVGVSSEGSQVRFKADLTMDEVNQLLSVLDEKPTPEQGTPPVDGSSATPAP